MEEAIKAYKIQSVFCYYFIATADTKRGEIMIGAK
jgi:hypothetical protein